MTPAAPRSAPLNRERVVTAAVAFADRDGLAALSMRSLSAELGVVPMALYKHVSDKDDLIAGMIAMIVSGYPVPPPELAGRAAVRFRIHGAREALRRHPWLRAAIEKSTHRTPVVLHYLDALAGDLAAAGFSYDLIHYGMHALGFRVWGFNPEAFAPAPGTPPPPPPNPATLAALAAAFPHVSAVALDSATRNPSGACDDDREFDFTVELLLDALDRLHASGWVSR